MMKKEILFTMLAIGFVATNGSAMDQKQKAIEKKLRVEQIKREKTWWTATLKELKDVYNDMYPQYKEQIREEELRQEKLKRHNLLMRQIYEDDYR